MRALLNTCVLINGAAPFLGSYEHMGQFRLVVIWYSQRDRRTGLCDHIFHTLQNIPLTTHNPELTAAISSTECCNRSRQRTKCCFHCRAHMCEKLLWLLRDVARRIARLHKRQSLLG